MKAALVLPSLLLASCASFLVGPTEQPPEDVDEERGPQRLERFAGTWVVDQPFHAGYEASWYELDRSGELRHLRTDDFGGGLAPGFTHVGTASILVEGCEVTAVGCEFEAETTCGFSGSWRSEGADTLVVDGECDDGQAREIELRFPGDAAGNAAGVTGVEVVRIGNVRGRVRHQGFDWRFMKCADANGAVLSESWGCTGFE